jgi:hypothetical protein
MEPFNTNQNPVASGSQMPPISSEERSQGGPSAPKSGVGPIAGAVIVIILLIAGGLYFWGSKLNHQSTDIPAYIPSDDSSQEEIPPIGELNSDSSAGLPAQSSSDDTASIQSDFNAMDTDQMNSQNSAEMNNI